MFVFNVKLNKNIVTTIKYDVDGIQYKTRIGIQTDAIMAIQYQEKQ